MDELMNAINQVDQVDFKLDKLQYLVRSLLNDMENIGNEKDFNTAAYFLENKDDYITALDIMLDYVVGAHDEADKVSHTLLAIKHEVEDDMEPVAVKQ